MSSTSMAMWLMPYTRTLTAWFLLGVCRRGLAGTLGGLCDASQQHRCRDRPDAAWHRCQQPRDAGHRVVVDVSDEMPIDEIRTHVDDRRTWFDHLCGYKARMAHRGHEDLAFSGDRRHALGVRIADGHSGIGSGQQERDGTADDRR